jgi:hypothetical protein
MPQRLISGNLQKQFQVGAVVFDSEQTPYHFASDTALIASVAAHAASQPED